MYINITEEKIIAAEIKFIFRKIRAIIILNFKKNPIRGGNPAIDRVIMNRTTFSTKELDNIRI